MKLLVVDDEPEICNLIRLMLEEEGHQVVTTESADAAEKALGIHKFDAVFCDIFMRPRTGIQLLESLQKTLKKLPPFIFVTGATDQTAIEKANKISNIDVILKPFSSDQLIDTLNKILLREKDQIFDIMEMMRQMSGVSFGENKRKVVETRLMRRSRELNLKSVDDYFDYFHKHREQELTELVSHLTTHHTFFFREYEHFQFLKDSIFPNAIKSNSNLNIWSGASSSGEEAYSIAITWVEYLTSQNINLEQAPKLKIWGSDIDDKSVERAREGVYTKEHASQIPQKIFEKYFDSGKNELSHLIRIKDFIHTMCEFKKHNLMSPLSEGSSFDVIFLRNVLIYFKPQEIAAIIKNMEKSLKPQGHLILGHSESLQGINSSLLSKGNSIYQLKSFSNESKATESRANGSVKQDFMKVLIIDDSSTVRSLLKKILSKDKGFTIVGEAESGKNAYDLVLKTKPDVVTLDIHMPEMDGIAYLRSIHDKPHPPIVMISSVSASDAKDAMLCFELGISDYIEKPSGDLLKQGELICEIIQNAKHQKRHVKTGVHPKRQSKLVVYDRPTKDTNLICIGSSTGGVQALQTVLTEFPSNSPPVLIVQHIPPVFSKAMADRLNSKCKITVKEAEDNEAVLDGTAYVAPGGKQMSIVRSGTKLKISISDGAPVNRHKPSVDFLFHSVANIANMRKISACLLTGMGNDGAKGLLALKQAHAHTIAQDEESCVVFGMPKAAIEINAANEILPLQSISYHLFHGLNKRANT